MALSLPQTLSLPPNGQSVWSGPIFLLALGCPAWSQTMPNKLQTDYVETAAKRLHQGKKMANQHAQPKEHIPYPKPICDSSIYIWTQAINPTSARTVGFKRGFTYTTY